MVGWLIGNAVFSEMALRIFLIFCMKLGDSKSRKVIEPDFWKKFLIRRYSRKHLQISPKSDTLIFFSKTVRTIFLVLGLQFESNLFFRGSSYLDIFDLEIVKKIDFASLVFLDFAHNDRLAWCLVLFLQFAGPVNAFLF